MIPLPFRRLASGALALAALTVALPSRAQVLDDTGIVRFLVQAQCLDEAGRLTGATPIDPRCERRRAQSANDPASYRKNDWADVRHPGNRAFGYQASDAVLSAAPGGPGAPVTIAHTYDFGLGSGEGFGSFHAPAGDGGDVMTLENGVVSIFMTEDGAGGLQWFVGEGCRTRRASPDRAWLLFADDVRPGVWRDDVARLLLTKDRDACPRHFSSAYTRWTRASIPFPFRRSGQPAGTVALDTLVSEHYDLPSIPQSSHLERFFFARDLGKVRWERWEHRAAPDAAILQKAADMSASARCPQLPYSDTPGPGWYMVDCRMWTNLVPPPEGWSTRDFGWGGLAVRAR